MKEINLSTYSDFKAIVSSKSLLPQYHDVGNFYFLFAVESSVCWQYSLAKDGGSDQTDFENTYRASCNQPLEIKAAAGRPLRVSASPQPLNTIQHWKGFQLVIPAGQTSAYLDISFASTIYLRGGNIVSPDVDFDDSVSVDVLLAANSAPYIPGIISNAYMIPSLPISFESAESMAFPPVVKLRVTVNIGAVQETDVHANILVNYFI